MTRSLLADGIIPAEIQDKADRQQAQAQTYRPIYTRRIWADDLWWPTSRRGSRRTMYELRRGTCPYRYAL